MTWSDINWWDVAQVVAWGFLIAGSILALFFVLVLAVEMFRQRSVRLRSERERRVIVLQHRDGSLDRIRVPSDEWDRAN